MAARKKAKKAKKSKKARKAPARKKAARKKGPIELIVSKSRTKAAVKSAGFKTAGDFYEALDGAVRDCIAKAVDRADANKRATVRPQDL